MSLTAITKIFEKSDAQGNERLLLLCIADLAVEEGNFDVQTPKILQMANMTYEEFLDTVDNCGHSGELVLYDCTPDRFAGVLVVVKWD